MSEQLTNDSECVREVWSKYFDDIPLTETRWFERIDRAIFERALGIASEKRKNGKKFQALDEKNVGKYVTAIGCNIEKGFCTSEFWFKGDYRVTNSDRSRFQRKIKRSGGCLLFRGAKTSGGYGRFWVNERSVNAHFFAFFLNIGYLPAPQALGGVNGLQVAHTCGNRRCCNHLHLRLTTKDANLSERVYGVASTPKRDDYGRNGTCSPKDMPGCGTNGLDLQNTANTSIEI